MKYIGYAALPLLIGFVMDGMAGDPYWLPHPVRLIGNGITRGEALFRTLFSRREKLAGFCLLVLILFYATAVPLLLLILCYRIRFWFGILMESVCCYYLIAAKCLKVESMKVYGAITDDDVEGARKAVSMIVGRDTESLDRTGIVKAAVETVAENTSDGVTAPIFYMAFGGAVLAFFYKACNTMDSMIGYKNERYENFGKYAAKLDDMVNYIPSRLTALLMILAAYLLNFHGKQAYRIWRRDRRNHASPNSAQTESVCAGALDIQLAGDAWYFGTLYHKKTIGDNGRPIEKEDIRRANQLMYVSSIFMLLLAIGLRVLLIGIYYSFH